MKYFMCVLEEDGWSHVYTKEKDFIFADDIEEARVKIAKEWKIRKNAKGLRIVEIKPINTFRYSKYYRDLVSETTWNSFTQCKEESQYYSRRKHFFCGNCNGEIESQNEICSHCGAFIREDK